MAKLTDLQRSILHVIRGHRTIGCWWQFPENIEAARDLEALGLVHGLLDHDPATGAFRRVWVATEYLEPSCGSLVPGVRP